MPDLVNPKWHRGDETRTHLEQQSAGMNQSHAEKCLESAGGRVELVKVVRPNGDVEGDVKEPLRTVGDPVLQFDRVVECRAPPRIGAAAMLVDDSERRREFTDATFEERHDSRPAARPDVQSKIQDAVERLEVTKPTRV